MILIQVYQGKWPNVTPWLYVRVFMSLVVSEMFDFQIHFLSILNSSHPKSCSVGPTVCLREVTNGHWPYNRYIFVWTIWKIRVLRSGTTGETSWKFEKRFVITIDLTKFQNNVYFEPTSPVQNFHQGSFTVHFKSLRINFRRVVRQ